LRSDRDIEWLKQNNLSVACDNSSTFVKDYLVNVSNFPSQQVVNVDKEQDIVEKFKNKTISAYIVESPYAKIFLNKYCKGYTATTAASKFGGMGFVSAYNFFFSMFTFTKSFAFILFFHN
jgi:seryl-tRNA synthetase